MRRTCAPPPGGSFTFERTRRECGMTTTRTTDDRRDRYTSGRKVSFSSIMCHQEKCDHSILLERVCVWRSQTVYILKSIDSRSEKSNKKITHNAVKSDTIKCIPKNEVDDSRDWRSYRRRSQHCTGADEHQKRPRKRVKIRVTQDTLSNSRPTKENALNQELRNGV